MPEPSDWLSRLLEIFPVAGRLELRCLYGTPWQVVYDPSAEGEMPYHVILAGAAVLEDPAGGPSRRLGPGDIVVFPRGGAHRLYDGGEAPAGPDRLRPQLNLVLAENDGAGERLDMLCGRFVLDARYGRLMRELLPDRLVIGGGGCAPRTPCGTGEQLASLVGLMRHESAAENLGGRVMLDALSTAMFALVLRRASESGEAPAGLLAVAAHPRLAPALHALFNRPERPWTLPELARLCNMSRATIARHFQETLGRSASELHTEIRMSIAANALQATPRSVGEVADMVGYQSEAAFQRVFKQHVGSTPAQWRRLGSQPHSP